MLTGPSQVVHVVVEDRRKMPETWAAAELAVGAPADLSGGRGIVAVVAVTVDPTVPPVTRWVRDHTPVSAVPPNLSSSLVVFVV